MALDHLCNSLSPALAETDDFATICDTLSTLQTDAEIDHYLEQVTARLRAPGSGFSLVELSIVLVILGLLVGGVLSGQSLIHAAELRSVIRDDQKYMAATQSFREKYNALPGDMANATSYWGAAAACPGVSTTAAGGTCNGDGNNMITQAATTANPGNETLRYWQQLGLAGMIEGSFTGTVNSTSATTYTVGAGINSPAGRIAKTNWQMVWLGAFDVNSTYYYAGNYGNALFITKTTIVPGPTAPPGFPATVACTFKAEDAWNLDKKVDDGKPATGTLVTTVNSSNNTICGGTCDDTTANPAYILSNSNLACDLIFKSGS